MPWEPLPGQHHDPSPLSAGLERLVRSLGAGSVGGLKALFERWSEIVGPDLAEVCRPVELRHGVLVVAVSDPVWRGELRWQTDRIVQGATEVLGQGTVERVEIVSRSPAQPS